MSRPRGRKPDSTQPPASDKKPHAVRPARQMEPAEAFDRVRAAAGRADAAALFRLQRAAGNRAVSRLVQAKLAVGPAGDKYEQEADAVADRVLRMPDAQISMSTNEQVGESANQQIGKSARRQDDEGVQRQPEEEEELQMKPAAQRHASGGLEAGDEFERQLSAAGGGKPLPDAVRSHMEPRFGADFGKVRVHTGGRSVQLNREIGAQAFTHGSDVFFGAGKYNPGTTGGKHLLAHELTHVVQQGGAAQRKPLSTGKQAAEPTAAVQRAAKAVSASGISSAGMPRIQRLTVDHTQWSTVTSISASGSGASGVLFFDDGNGPVVVKPNVHGAEEQIAAHLHETVSQATGAAQGGWNISALSSRIAADQDVTGIQAAVAHIFGGTPPPARVGNLLQQVAAGTTMIQTAARQEPGERGTFGGQMAGAAQTGHTDKSWRGKPRLKKDDPMKPLINEPGLSVTLGRAAAMDIFLGNNDRFAGMANFENWMTSARHKAVYLIDNVVDNEKGRFEAWKPPATGGAFGGGPTGGFARMETPKFTVWTNWTLTQMLAQLDFNSIADAIWSSGTGNAAISAGLQSTMYDELIGGETTGTRNPFVEANERATLTTKLDKHIGKIKQNFAQGLQEGRNAIVSHNSGFLPDNLPVSKGAKVMYRARILVLQGQTAAVAMNQARQDVLTVTL